MNEHGMKWRCNLKQYEINMLIWYEMKIPVSAVCNEDTTEDANKNGMKLTC